MYANGGYMINFENELDRIRIDLYEKTKEMEKNDIIKSVNSHAEKIALDFGFSIKKKINEEYFQVVNT
jgi:hypothetical protein